MKLELIQQERYSVNEILNLVPENKEEWIFLKMFEEQIKNEIIEKLDKSIENFKHFVR